MKNFLGISILLGLFSFEFSLNAQPFSFSSQFCLSSSIKPPPNVQHLTKGIDYSISQYTGQPTITIPLFTVKGRTLSTPVSLSYTATGIRVEDLPGIVGNGWSLNAGGAITRTMNGLIDESFPNGFLFKSELVQSGTYNTGSNLYAAAHGTLDLEPDIFNFS